MPAAMPLMMFRPTAPQSTLVNLLLMLLMIDGILPTSCGVALTGPTRGGEQLHAGREDLRQVVDDRADDAGDDLRHVGDELGQGLRESGDELEASACRWTGYFAGCYWKPSMRRR